MTNLSAPTTYKDDYPPIEDYGLIGDLRTAALVGNRGSIDFKRFPEFDPPSIFCANVDREDRGRFQIEPQFRDMRENTLYLPDTNFLINRFLSESGIAELSNYMVVSADENARSRLRRPVRSGPKEFLFSRVMCWVALDRAIRLAHKRGLPSPIERWTRERDRIHNDVFDNFWNEKNERLSSLKAPKPSTPPRSPCRCCVLSAPPTRNGCRPSTRSDEN